MRRLFENKIIFLVLMIQLFVCCIVSVSFAIWGRTDKGGIYWVNEDNTFPKSQWKVIDDDGDGVGYYYYFNDNGFILIDDITPDYNIVNAAGRKIDMDGNEVTELMSNVQKSLYDYTLDGDSYVDPSQLVSVDGDVTGYQSATHVSSGQVIEAKSDEMDGPKPSDGLVIDVNPDGTAKYILGKNVVLKAEKDRGFDTSIDRKMQNYIVSGSNYGKKVNGTTYTKSKWKDCMSLKGTGATIVFENPKNNFNKLKGRIATHHFTYTERTTNCILRIYDEDSGEELTSTSGFNYNGGCSFECIFPRKSSKVRFELEVEGQYTSRVCYLRDCEYGFDKSAYEDELYEDEVDAEYRRRYKIGTESEVDYEEEDEIDDGMGEKSLEGEDPGVRYRRINNILTEDDLLRYSEDDEDITDAMRASISELKRRLSEEAEKKDRVSGPAFDENLKNRKPNVGPTGLTNIYGGKDEGDAE